MQYNKLKKRSLKTRIFTDRIKETHLKSTLEHAIPQSAALSLRDWSSAPHSASGTREATGNQSKRRKKTVGGGRGGAALAALAPDPHGPHLPHPHTLKRMCGRLHSQPANAGHLADAKGTSASMKARIQELCLMPRIPALYPGPYATYAGQQTTEQAPCL